MKLIDIQNAKNTASYNVADAIFEMRITIRECLRSRTRELYDIIWDVYNEYIAGIFPYVLLRMQKSNIHFRDVKFNKEIYHRYENLFVNGDIEELMLIGCEERYKGLMGGFGITCDINRYVLKNDLNGFVYKEPISKMTKEKMDRLIGLFKSISKNFNCINGYIGISDSTSVSFIERTPLEFYSDMYAFEAIDIRLRGVYWGNLVSQNIVDILGGIDNIKNGVQHYCIEEVNGKLQKNVYIQLTEDILNCTIEDILVFKKYLDMFHLLPLLCPEKYDAIKNYRAIKDSINAFILRPS